MKTCREEGKGEGEGEEGRGRGRGRGREREGEGEGGRGRGRGRGREREGEGEGEGGRGRGREREGEELQVLNLYYKGLRRRKSPYISQHRVPAGGDAPVHKIVVFPSPLLPILEVHVANS